MQTVREKNILSRFIQYVSKNVIGMIGLSCYILADTFFIARGLGENGLTALNLVIPIYSFMNGLGLMIGMGGATRYTILKTNEKKEQMSAVFTQAVVFAFGVSLFFMIMGIVGSNQISRWLGADDSIYKITTIYLRTLLCFAPLFFLNNVMICFVRNDGNPSLSMAAMLIGSISNIGLDYLFVFPCKLGMFGAALATGTAPIISLCILSFHKIQKKNQFHLRIKEHDSDNKEFINRNVYTMVKNRIGNIACIKDICMLGSASLITEVSSGIVMIIFNVIILNIQGNMGVAAYGIIANIALVVIAIFTGIAQGIQPIVSQNYGLGEKKNLSKIYRYGMVTAIIISGLIYIIVTGFSEQIIELFNKEKNIELQKIATEGMYLYFTAFFFSGINIVTATFFGAIDQPIQSFFISMLRGFIVIIPVVFLLSACFGMTGVWIALTCAEFITVLYSIFCIMFRKTGKKPVFLSNK